MCIRDRPLISVAVVKISWDVHLRAMGAVGHWAENTINLSVIAELFSGTAPQYRYDVLENFALYLLRARTEGGVVHYAPVMILGIGLLLSLIHIYNSNILLHTLCRGSLFG